MDDALVIDDLRVAFDTVEGTGLAVNGVGFSIGRGETVALVGESGCGKSVTAMSVLRLLPSPPSRLVAGRVVFEGRDLLALPMEEMRGIRGRDIAMIFQEPMTSLNPVFTIGDQIAEAIRAHEKVAAREARTRAIELLNLVRIPDAAKRVDDYPHRLSGGMRQRAMIAMALACKPRLLIADEPTTALDVTIQAQILDLLRKLQAELGTALLLITHNLGIVAEMAQRVVVMYAGRIVEQGDVRAILKAPRHPYTRGLLGATPEPPHATSGARGTLAEIPGLVPSLFAMPEGCAFAPRCSYATDRCRQSVPMLEPTGTRHHAACFELDRVTP
ncbi:MAG: ABC transporter ATP-binding protein [Alphaproteobacteria bacterium]|nr:ABC transporter ATP-binding protein [Alphaproteobacteria bacterium]